LLRGSNPSILTAPSDGARAAQLQLGLDLTQVNADGTTGLPMPTVIIAGSADLRLTGTQSSAHFPLPGRVSAVTH
jgi:hypothetical protein